METKIELTKAELEMIQLKREQDELKAKEEEIKRELKREKEITNTRKEIADFLAKQDIIKTMTYRFAKELNDCSPGKYEVVETPITRDFKAWGYISSGSFEKETYLEEKVPFIHYTIKRGTIEMKVDRYDGAYKIQYNFKYYKIAKTVDTKINELFARQDREKKLKEAKATAKETVLVILQEKYPNTKIEHRQEYHSRGHRYNEGYYTEHYKVTFPNGLAIDFQYYEDGRISSGDIKGLYNFDLDTLVDVLSKIEQTEVK